MYAVLSPRQHFYTPNIEDTTYRHRFVGTSHAFHSRFFIPNDEETTYRLRFVGASSAFHSHFPSPNDEETTCQRRFITPLPTHFQPPNGEDTTNRLRFISTSIHISPTPNGEDTAYRARFIGTFYLFPPPRTTKTRYIASVLLAPPALSTHILAPPNDQNTMFRRRFIVTSPTLFIQIQCFTEELSLSWLGHRCRFITSHVLSFTSNLLYWLVRSISGLCYRSCGTLLFVLHSYTAHVLEFYTRYTFSLIVPYSSNEFAGVSA